VGILVDQSRPAGSKPRWRPSTHTCWSTGEYNGQWWLDTRKLAKQAVTTHVVNLAWNGLANLEPEPTQRSR
jgi:hypothetical protein